MTDRCQCVMRHPSQFAGSIAARAHAHHAVAARRQRRIVGDQHQRGAALGVAGEHQIDDLARRLPRRDCRSARRRSGSPGWARARARARRAAARRRRAPPDSGARRSARPTAASSLRGALVRVGDAGEFERHRDVLERRHGRDQVERLEHDPDIAAAEARQRVLVERGRASSPATTTEPVSGRSSPAMTISSVDLPEPDGPTRPIASPRPILQVDVFEDMHAGRAAPERQVDAGERDRRAPRA